MALDDSNVRGVAVKQENSNTENQVSANTSEPPFSHLTRLSDEIEILLALSFFGICGSLARNGLVQLTEFENLGSVWPNFAGCFVISFIPAMLGPTLVGIVGTGFCGALTSFSELITDIFTESTSHTPEWPNKGYGVPLFIARVLVELSCSFAAYLAGKHAGDCITALHISHLSQSTEIKIRRACEVLGVAAWIVCLVTAITSRIAVKWWALCGLFAPFGVWIRFYLSQINSERRWFKLGTFTANTLAVTVACVCQTCYMLPGITPLQKQILIGLQRGFTGCLSTVSTFIREINAMKLLHGYLYGAISLFVGYALSFIIIGSYKWTI